MNSPIQGSAKIKAIRFNLFALILICSILIINPARAQQTPTQSKDITDEDILNATKDQLLKGLELQYGTLDEGPQKEKMMRFHRKLSLLSGEQLGAFLGAAVGKDPVEAYKALGAVSAEYFLDDFKEKLKELTGGDQGLVQYTKYVPVNADQSKKIVRNLMDSDYDKAYAELNNMVFSEGKSVGETITKDAMAGLLDWACSGAGVAPGVHFLALIEIEKFMIKVLEVELYKNLDSGHVKKYIELRAAGKKPSETFNELSFMAGQRLSIVYFEKLYQKSAEGLTAADQMRARIRRTQHSKMKQVRARLITEMKEFIEALTLSQNAFVKELGEKIKLVNADLESLEDVFDKLSDLNITLKKRRERDDKTGLRAQRLDAASLGQKQTRLEELNTFFTKKSNISWLDKNCERAIELLDDLTERSKHMNAILDNLTTLEIGYSKTRDEICRMDSEEREKAQRLASELRADIIRTKTYYSSDWSDYDDGYSLSLAELESLKNRFNEARDKSREIEKETTDFAHIQQLLDRSDKTLTDLSTRLESAWTNFNTHCTDYRKVIRSAENKRLDIQVDAQHLYDDSKIVIEEIKSNIDAIRQDSESLRKSQEPLKELGDRIEKWFKEQESYCGFILRMNTQKYLSENTQFNTKFQKLMKKLQSHLSDALACAVMLDEVMDPEREDEAIRLLEAAIDIGLKIPEWAAALADPFDKLLEAHRAYGAMIERLSTVSARIDPILIQCSRAEALSPERINIIRQDSAKAQIELNAIRDLMVQLEGLTFPAALDEKGQIEDEKECERVTAQVEALHKKAIEIEMDAGPHITQIGVLYENNTSGFPQASYLNRVQRDVGSFMTALTGQTDPDSKRSGGLLTNGQTLLNTYSQNDFNDWTAFFKEIKDKATETFPRFVTAIQKVRIILDAYGNETSTQRLRDRTDQAQTTVEERYRDIRRTVGESEKLIPELVARRQKLSALVNKLNDARSKIESCGKIKGAVEISQIRAIRDMADMLHQRIKFAVKEYFRLYREMITYCQRFSPEEQRRIDQAIQDLVDDMPDDICDKVDVPALLDRLNAQKNEASRHHAAFIQNANKFEKELNDRTSKPCTNGILAYTFYQAVSSARVLRPLIDSLYDLTAELLNISAKCPEKAAQIRSGGYNIASLIDGIAEMSTYEDILTSMLGRLTEEGCDEKDILVLGENSLPPGTDADAAQDGANFTEVPGDGEDNDFDATSDEPRYPHPGMNVVFIIGDWGSLKDDVFELVIGTSDKVARTNKADRVEIPRKVDPGTYTATATVISAPDNAGTMYFLIYEYGGRIAPPVKGTWPEGGSVSVTFTVTGSR